MYRSRPNPTTYSLWVLIAINVVLYFAVLADPRLVDTLGLRPADWLERPWTLVTTLFVHGGLWHVLANMLTLFFFGRFIASLVGEARFLLVYFLGGIAGSLVFVVLGPPYSIVVGASGAVFAVGGALTVMMPRLRVYVFPIPAPLPLWAAVVGGFVILSLLPFVAWQAHLGGLVVGLIAGALFRRRQRYTMF